jgi:hypothetical protein
LREEVRDRRLIVLFFDLTSLQPQDLVRTTTAAKKFLHDQMTPADLVGVMAFGNQLHVVSDFTTDRDQLNTAVDSIIPGKESQLANLADAAATGVETAVSEDTDAAFTADETEFNVFNTDRKLAALESVTDLLRDIPGKKVGDSVQQRNHADWRGQPLPAPRHHGRREPRQRRGVHGGLARLARGDSRRRSQRGRRQRQLHVFRGSGIQTKRRARRFARNSLDIGERHGRPQLLRSGRSGPGLQHGPG